MTLARKVIQIARDARDGSTEAPSERPTRADDATTPDMPPGIYASATPGHEPFEIVADGELKLRIGGREVSLEALDEDLFLAPDPTLDRFAVRVDRLTNGERELWHGGHRYVRAGLPSRPLPEARAELRAIVGHYRSHNPWTTNFRVLLRGDQPWLFFAAAPDGFATEQQLVPLADGSFRVGDDCGNPERLSFDALADGRALRAWLSGWPYYRAG
jgi:hypothetical protein